MSTNTSIVELLGDLDFDPAQLKTKYLSERDKRIRPDGADQYIEVTNEFSHYVEDPYVETALSRQPLCDEVDIAIIGGGFGGLLAGAKLVEAGRRRSGGNGYPVTKSMLPYVLSLPNSQSALPEFFRYASRSLSTSSSSISYSSSRLK